MWWQVTLKLTVSPISLHKDVSYMSTYQATLFNPNFPMEFLHIPPQPLQYVEFGRNPIEPSSKTAELRQFLCRLDHSRKTSFIGCQVEPKRTDYETVTWCTDWKGLRMLGSVASRSWHTHWKAHINSHPMILCLLMYLLWEWRKVCKSYLRCKTVICMQDEMWFCFSIIK